MHRKLGTDNARIYVWSTKMHRFIVRLSWESRELPHERLSIPRLELAAATVSVRVADMLKAELDYEDVEEFYWTDSEVVLGFINNESRRFHVYVANRVQLIRDHTSPKQWRYVGSSSNPC